ncbi:Rha family transcriptional regulator [Neobacillus endophyticus]|uniref:Rha family transcriptional regulator n=1 Tax=Neobacillus endophyticus TaxID=2738405 RepID=UPI001FE3C815|nr:Rha family transcriptional regulator [Neobacillus endophyticus]
MNELIVIEQNGQLLIDSREVSLMVGKDHSNLMRDIRGYVSILENSKLNSQNFFIPSTYKTEGNNKTYDCFLLTRKGCDMVANKMTGEKGVLFTAAYVTKFEQMENHIRISQAKVSPALKDSFEMQLIGVEYTSKILRVDETSKIRMLEAAHKQHQVPTNHLPAYVDEEVTKSLSQLLKDHDIKLSSAKVNTKLIELGILEIKERPSSKGGMKEFKSLTEKGLEYGKNLLNPKSPKDTQPHYYPSKFITLMELLKTDAVLV